MTRFLSFLGQIGIVNRVSFLLKMHFGDLTRVMPCPGILFRQLLVLADRSEYNLMNLEKLPNKTHFKWRRHDVQLTHPTSLLHRVLQALISSGYSCPLRNCNSHVLLSNIFRSVILLFWLYSPTLWPWTSSLFLPYTSLYQDDLRIDVCT